MSDHQLTGAEIVFESPGRPGQWTRIFGVTPGGAVLPIYDALFKQNHVRHIPGPP